MKDSNFKQFMLLWLGELISQIGGGLTSFGLGVYVFQLTGSAGKMAIVTLIGFLPTLLLSVPAGALADKYDRRILMMMGDGFSAIGIIYILVNMILGRLTFIRICVGVLISSVFSSLLEPAYRSTISDMLTEEDYSKASGLVSLAGNARYLVSPILAGLLLTFCDITVLFIIDISTFVLTVITTFVVKKGIKTTVNNDKNQSLLTSIKEGWTALSANKGVISLVLVSAVLTLFIGVFQILAEPMVLSFSDAKTLGTTETICALGMVVSGLLLGIKGIKKGYVKVLSISLAMAGVFIALFGVWENVILMCVFGFAFFLMLPFANGCLDYLVRTNVPDELQGRVWGFIGFLSQIGYVVAYGLSGVLADGISKVNGISVGRGASVVVIGAGIALVVLAILPVCMKSIKALEKPEDAAEMTCEEVASN